MCEDRSDFEDVEYNEWVKGNIEDLKDEFIEMFKDQFEYHCKHEFDRSMN